MSIRPKTRWLVLLLVLAAPPASAQTVPADEAQRIAELEQENARLRQELADLRLELTQLKRAIEAQAHERGEDAEDSPEEGENDTDPGGMEDESDAREPRTYTSADEIYRAIPDQFNPGRDGWDIVQRVAVANWLTENIPGSRFDARLEVHRVEMRYDTTRKDWGVTVHFANREMRYMSWEMEQRVSSVTLRGDSDFADRARRLEVGSRVQVTGTIRATSWGVGHTQKPDENWAPEYCEVRLEDADVRSPHLRR